MKQSVKVGIVGTSWWADAMYLPALSAHEAAEVVAVCGRNQERAQAFAERWQIQEVYADYAEMLASAALDAVIVATGNDTHHPITMAALARGLHVLCEKPLALNVAEAEEMTAAARTAGVKTLVPFTYRFMPATRYLKRLIDAGYLGRPYHLNLRYYANYGREPGYRWRYDVSKAGTGVLGDLGAHFIYLARWYFGEVAAVSCHFAYLVDRGEVDDEGRPFERTEDVCTLLLEFANGAQGVIHVTCLAHEDTNFGQRHGMEFHGAGGTLYHRSDWDAQQEVYGSQPSDGGLHLLPIPDDIWGQARRAVVHETYKDVFRVDRLMIGEWVDAIVNDTAVDPNFEDGLAVQRILDAALESAKTGRRIAVQKEG